MIKNIILISILLLTGCTQEKANTLTDEQVIAHAQEDYNLALSGKLPKFAQEDNSQGLPADGGTRYYKADGYKLEIRKSIADTKEDGYMYGPSIVFDKVMENGKPKTMSDIKFYKDEDLKKLLGDRF